MSISTERGKVAKSGRPVALSNQENPGKQLSTDYRRTVVVSYN